MGAENHRTGPQQRPLAGYGLVLSACALITISMVGVGVAVLMFQVNESLSRVLGLSFLSLLVPALALWRTGRRHFAKTAKAALSRDARSPILYLRSFSQDKTHRNSEDAFAKLFAPIGPLVAIGDPTDRLPELGAYRDYVPDDEWQDVVTSYIREARLVLLSIGRTPGLAWELARCRELLSPSRLIVLVSCDESEYEHFREAARLRDVDLPDYPQLPAYAYFNNEPLRSLYEPLSGIISFEEGWKAQMTPVVDPGYDFGSHVTIGDCLVELLRPRGIVLPQPRSGLGW
jgi:hypothetical protein